MRAQVLFDIHARDLPPHAHASANEICIDISNRDGAEAGVLPSLLRRFHCQVARTLQR